MKRIFNIILSCTLLFALMGGADLIVSSCTPESQPGEEQKDPDDSTEEEETPSAPGTAAAFSKFISLISKGETIQIPLQGEWNLLYKGFKVGDKITITMVNDASVTFTLECTSADDVAGAVFTIPADTNKTNEENALKNPNISYVVKFAE